MSDPEQAAIYSEAQHAGSLGPGRTLARMVDLSGCRSLLDVGGGTGAMSIRLLEAFPDLVSTIVDFPNVAEIGWRFVAEAGMVDRVRYIPSNALTAECRRSATRCSCPTCSAAFRGPRRRAWSAAPTTASRPAGISWCTTSWSATTAAARRWPRSGSCSTMAFTPEARSLTPGWLRARMEEAGFAGITEEELVPGMTRLVHARRGGLA